MPRRSTRERLSRRLSYLLRHNPGELELELDEQGYTRISVEKFAKRLGVSVDAILDVVRNDPKGRFDIRNGRIRANYGHSIPLGRRIWENQPPAALEALPRFLYHGTTQTRAQRIRREGLLPKGRQFVHLSTTVDTAVEVGRRYTASPVLLLIDVPCALSHGVRMWVASPSVVLSTAVPPECIRPAVQRRDSP